MATRFFIFLVALFRPGHGVERRLKDILGEESVMQRIDEI